MRGPSAKPGIRIDLSAIMAAALRQALLAVAAVLVMAAAGTAGAQTRGATTFESIARAFVLDVPPATTGTPGACSIDLEAINGAVLEGAGTTGLPVERWRGQPYTHRDRAVFLVPTLAVIRIDPITCAIWAGLRAQSSAILDLPQTGRLTEAHLLHAVDGRLVSAAPQAVGDTVTEAFRAMAEAIARQWREDSPE